MICPLCASDLQGEAIPQEYRDKGYYGDSTHYSRVISIEVRGVYDGGLYYQCPDCGGAFHRWIGDDRMRAKAQPYIDRHNADLVDATMGVEDDGKILIAGVLYDRDSGEEAAGP